MTELRVDAAEASADTDWPDVLVAYERAVATMQGVDADDPTEKPTHELGWRYQAAIHGAGPSDDEPDTSDPAWCACQHGSWFFLPWHRMYLAAFEQVVQHHLDDDSWRLPYWYAMDPDRADGGRLPPAFVEERHDNALFTAERSILANRGRAVVTDGEDLLIALGRPAFTQPDDDSRVQATFGGGERRRPVPPNAGERGALEGAPHGSIHMNVGADFDRRGRPVRVGLMAQFVTAALDPIFWLHHANIDRQWQVWLELDPAHSLPTDDRDWMETRFTFPAPPGKTATWTIAEVLDTEALGYRYDDVSPPSALAPAGRAAFDLAAPEGPVPEPVPRVLGGVEGVALHTDDPVTVDLEQDDRFALGAADAGDGRVMLRIEAVTGEATAPGYGVYVNVPPGDDPAAHPELRVGGVSTFGLRGASATNDLHAGEGLSFVFDMTAVRDTLMTEGRWDPARVQVAFVPDVPPLPPDIAAAVEELDADPPAPDLRAAQIVVVGT